VRLVLVVDDEAGVRRMICTLLEREGYRTLDAAGGEEALAIVRADAEVGLVLTDVRMPGMNGLQLEQAIRGIRSELPVLLMSGEVTREWVVRLIREHPANVIRKPFESAELLAKVRELLGPEQTRDGDVGLG
jgi:DNA-binding NtrC family response regulator